MALAKPFRRIIRPFTDGDYIRGTEDGEDYLLCEDYAQDRSMLIRAYHVIERDLVRLYEYVEPSDKNQGTYSHRTYELLLRASTEFEANCKGILRSNEYVGPRGGNLDIRDYWKINTASRLSEYRVVLDAWSPGPKVFEPFREWATGHIIAWYKAYNTVKHNRATEFPQASLGNVMGAVTGLLVILFSQFYVHVLNPYQAVWTEIVGDDRSISTSTSLFRVVPPATWQPSEQYDFDWSVLKATASPFGKFIEW